MKGCFMLVVLCFYVFNEALAGVCPGGQFHCPGSQACCLTHNPGSHYGCCPLEHAVCCNDGEHCCPEGMTCDMFTSKCKNEITGSWLPLIPRKQSLITSKSKLTKLKSGNYSLANQDCPGLRSTCPAAYTCCETLGGGYGCCPFDGAVCCADKIHCCPSGNTCDVTHGKCSKVFENVGMVCPGGKVSCEDDNTCCSTGPGQFGCCPMPNAVCCSDEAHCCPQGTKCTATGFCIGVEDNS